MTGPVNGNLSPDSFAFRLRSAMFDRRLTVQALAQATGIGERLIRLYRAGSTVPVDRFGDPTPHCLRIAEALGVPWEELLVRQKEAA